ncbi:hypothetical protein Dsin_010045 [Dipteronia sinensis]|uniref:Uncharacterized protein n=1 Tax=Dipteronia sinensis TaxID=43782 RepID=A0AAE0ASP9_9ROSI|nr:hypothetical protein Dsin_010045 [Dipteronia sinensis]
MYVLKNSIPKLTWVVIYKATGTSLLRSTYGPIKVLHAFGPDGSGVEDMYISTVRGLRTWTEAPNEKIQRPISNSSECIITSHMEWAKELKAVVVVATDKVN